MSIFSYRTRAIKGRGFNSKIIFLPLGAPFTQESLLFGKYFLSYSQFCAYVSDFKSMP